MADDEQPQEQQQQQQQPAPVPLPETAASKPEESPAPTQPAGDRTELLSTARAFLNSPQVRHEDIAAKRNFLVQKGLNDGEINELLREAVSVRPLRRAIPPY